MDEFIKKRCDCGCKKLYYGFKTNPEASEWSIITYTGGNNPEPLVIKRLLDGQEFRLGDTIQRITPRGKRYTRAVLYNIQIELSGFMQLHCYVIGSGGTACIRNNKSDYQSADDPNLFNYIINITKK